MSFLYKRLELHNHTTESDASITIEELIDLMAEDGADAFALTDHNTISGHPKAKALLQEKKLPLQCIYGMEYTTYYGHILCLNLTEYVPWENINFHKPELLFTEIAKKGAVAGIAHPFSFGYPFARGCRFDMTVTDYSNVDFIEIFNNPEPLHEVNEPGLLLWESLVLKGERLAATCGMDLHGRQSMAGQYATFIEGTKDGDVGCELTTAIHNVRTWVSKGPLLTWQKETDLSFAITQTDKPGYSQTELSSYLLVLTHETGELVYPFDETGSLTVPIKELSGNQIIIPKLYQNSPDVDKLICVSPVIYL